MAEQANPFVAVRCSDRFEVLHVFGQAEAPVVVDGPSRPARREALAGQSFADAGEIELATRVATKQLNFRAKP